METVKDTPYTSDIERAHAVHEAEFLDAQLTEQDTPWLESLRGKTVDETWLAEMNAIVAVGSIDLRTDTDPLTITEVMRAREQFYGVYLGWDQPDHPLHKKYQVFADTNIRTMPLATVIRTQRMLSAASVDVAKVVNVLPATLNYAPESVREKVANLEYLGLDTAKVVNTFPATLGYAPESVREKVANLEGLGLNAAKVVNASPTTLGYAPESVREKMSNLEDLGLNAAKVVNTNPMALSYAPESVREKMDNLEALGINASKVVNTSPVVLCYAPESVQKKIHRIARVGKLLGWEGDVATLIETMPTILGLSSNKLLAHARLFAEHGSVELTEKQVGKFIINALEAHIISLVQGKPYERRHIDAVGIAYKGTERKAMVAEMLQKQPELLEAKVGKKVLRAYRRYAGL